MLCADAIKHEEIKHGISTDSSAYAGKFHGSDYGALWGIDVGSRRDHPGEAQRSGEADERGSSGTL
jgi:hypothetical protein